MKNFGRYFKHLILVAVLFACPFVSQVKAVLLSPGGVLVGSLCAESVRWNGACTKSVPFSSGVLQGTLVSSVISGGLNTSNPFAGAGGLTFTYQIVVSSLSADSASQISVSSFASFQTRHEL